MNSLSKKAKSVLLVIGVVHFLVLSLFASVVQANVAVLAFLLFAMWGGAIGALVLSLLEDALNRKSDDDILHK